VRLSEPSWHFIGPGREDKEYRQVNQATNDCLQELAAGRINPMDIFNGDDGWLLLCDSFQTLAQRLKQDPTPAPRIKPERTSGDGFAS